MKIGLIGWGVETQSAYRHFGSEHNYLICNETPLDNSPEDSNVKVQFLEGDRAPGLAGNVNDLSYLDGVEECDSVIYSPVARKNLEKKYLPDHHFWEIAKTIQDIFFEISPTKNIIGVTGTKGKGTTTALIAKILETGGKKAHLGGNIGVAVLDLLPDTNEDDWVVLELSSFQLYKFPYSPHIAVHLMMMPEHIDEWHLKMEDYVEAKRNIFSHQSSEDIAIYLPTNEYSSENVQYSAGKHIPYTQSPGARVDSDGYLSINGVQIILATDVKLLGAHNLQNICAAVTAVWQVHQNIDAYITVLGSFSGLEHRLELAGEIDSVKYYDDSFGTTPDTAIVALDAFSNPKVLIVGGHEKGNPFKSLAERIAKDDLRHVIFIGTTGKKILDMAVTAGFDATKATIHEDGNSWTMGEIVEASKNAAQAGDVVLLSTGCASFGLFKDYKDRGEQFKAVVKGFAV